MDNRIMTDYKILLCSGSYGHIEKLARNLENDVNIHLQNGYELHGDLKMLSSSSTTTGFVQAVYKRIVSGTVVTNSEVVEITKQIKI